MAEIQTVHALRAKPATTYSFIGTAGGATSIKDTIAQRKVAGYQKKLTHDDSRASKLETKYFGGFLNPNKDVI